MKNPKRIEKFKKEDGIGKRKAINSVLEESYK